MSDESVTWIVDIIYALWPDEYAQIEGLLILYSQVSNFSESVYVPMNRGNSIFT